MKLPKIIDIHQSEELKQELIDELEKTIAAGEEEIILNAEQTEDVDAAGLQLLVSFKKTAAEEGISCKIENQPDMFSRLMVLSGGKYYCKNIVK